MTPAEREREARRVMLRELRSCAVADKHGADEACLRCSELVSAYRDAVEARVRWDQQAGKA